MAKEFIIAIELGSSRITGMAGKKNTDGSTTVLAVARENVETCIRKGVVYNIDKTVQCLTNIVNRLKTALKTDIAQVYVGVGGRSLRSVKNVISKDLPADTTIDQDMVADLMDTNRNMLTYPDYEIMDAITQEYKVDSQYQIDPIGIPASHLEGHFENILWQKSYYRNLRKCFELAGIKIAELYIAPLAMADAVLSETEKLSGCLLVDLGAETTTVQVYYRNILRHIAVIPLGGNNVTKDIASIQTDEPNAERMKLKYASALTDPKDIDKTLSYPIDQDRSIESSKFIEIVEGRVYEIVENVKNQIPAEYGGKLQGGIILTGGGSNMKNIEKAFQESMKIAKIRIAKAPNINVIASNPKNTPEQDGRSCSILSMLALGDMNCAGTEMGGDLFTSSAPKPSEPAHTGDKPAEPAKPATGVKAIKDEEERKRKEEEERKQKEDEERKAEEERKKNTRTNRFFKSISDFAKTLVTADSNE